MISRAGPCLAYLRARSNWRSWMDVLGLLELVHDINFFVVAVSVVSSLGMRPVEEMCCRPRARDDAAKAAMTGKVYQG